MGKMSISNQTFISAAEIRNWKLEEQKEAKRTQEAQDADSPKARRRETQDRYIPEEEPLSAGLYDKDGTFAPVRMSGDPAPTKESDALGKEMNKHEAPAPARASGSPAPAKKSGEDKECTGNTDEVDREIEKIKKEIKELKQRIAQTKDDPDKQKELKNQLSEKEKELRSKDNDTYRRQHTKFSYK